MNIADTIDYLLQKWQLSNVRSLGSFNNYVAVVYSALYKKDVVLKIVLADTHEPEALMLFDGHGCVPLLDYDSSSKGMLLEYILPGESLKTLFPARDDEAVEIAAEVIQQLHAKKLAYKTGEFKTITQWLEILATPRSPKIPPRFLAKARLLSDKVLALQQEQLFLHGDLHHENILKKGDSWIAIDPKGVVGPLEYEVGRFIMNPIPDLLKQKDAQQIIKKRIKRFARIFGFEEKRLLDWAFVQSLISACWTEEDGSEEFFNYFLEFARHIE